MVACQHCSDYGTIRRYADPPTSHPWTSLDYSRPGGFEEIPCPHCEKGARIRAIDARLYPPVRPPPTAAQLYGHPTPGGGVIYYEPFYR